MEVQPKVMVRITEVDLVDGFAFTSYSSPPSSFHSSTLYTRTPGTSASSTSPWAYEEEEVVGTPLANVEGQG